MPGVTSYLDTLNADNQILDSICTFHCSNELMLPESDIENNSEKD